MMKNKGTANRQSISLMENCTMSDIRPIIVSVSIQAFHLDMMNFAWMKTTAIIDKVETNLNFCEIWADILSIILQVKCIFPPSAK